MALHDPMFKGEVKGGKLYFNDRSSFDSHVASLEGVVEIIVRRPRKQRSKQENSYYWAVIIKIVSKETGALPEDVHYEFKRRFLRIGGTDLFPVLKSTTELTTLEAEDFYSQCRMFAASELGIQIPLPNEYI